MSRLLATLIFVGCITMATFLSPVFEAIQAQHETSSSALIALVGDSRRLFADQMFSMADVYFHSGYYPTIFDAKKKESRSHLDVASHESPLSKGTKPAEPDDDDSFLGQPKDWIDAFGRNFFPTVHTHLEGANAQEILPWLKMAAELDPKNIETYVTASYWLRTRLDKPREAEEFIREGLRANPDSPEILLELGRIYFYSKTNLSVAHNIFELAINKWNKQDLAGKEPDRHVREETWGELARIDQQTGNDPALLHDFEELEKISPNQGSVRDSIRALKAKLTPPTTP